MKHPIDLDINALATNRGEKVSLQYYAEGARVSVAGEFTGAVQVQYTMDDRDTDAWIIAGGLTHTGLNAGNFYYDEVVVPAGVLFVAVYTTVNLTNHAKPLKVRLVKVSD